MGDGILCFDNQIAFYASVLEDAIDPASCPIAVHERYEGFAGEVRRFDIGEVRESVPRRQYTRANRTQEGAGGQIGSAHVCTPVTHAQIVCRLRLEIQKQT